VLKLKKKKSTYDLKCLTCASSPIISTKTETNKYKRGYNTNKYLHFAVGAANGIPLHHHNHHHHTHHREERRKELCNFLSTSEPGPRWVEWEPHALFDFLCNVSFHLSLSLLFVYAYIYIYIYGRRQKIPSISVTYSIVTILKKSLFLCVYRSLFITRLSLFFLLELWNFVKLCYFYCLYIDTSSISDYKKIVYSFL